MANIFKYISASGYKLRCKTNCRDVFPVYGDCMCSTCTKNRRSSFHSQQADDCLADAQSGEIVKQATAPAHNDETQQNVTFSDEVEANLLMLDDSRTDHT